MGNYCCACEGPRVHLLRPRAPRCASSRIPAASTTSGKHIVVASSSLKQQQPLTSDDQFSALTSAKPIFQTPASDNHHRNSVNNGGNDVIVEDDEIAFSCRGGIKESRSLSPRVADAPLSGGHAWAAAVPFCSDDVMSPYSWPAQSYREGIPPAGSRSAASSFSDQLSSLRSSYRQQRPRSNRSSSGWDDTVDRAPNAGGLARLPNSTYSLVSNEREAKVISNGVGTCIPPGEGNSSCSSPGCQSSRSSRRVVGNPLMNASNESYRSLALSLPM